MELIRTILLRINEDRSLDGQTYKRFAESDFPPHGQEEIAYHVDLLLEAGLVEGLRTGSRIASIARLTWDGHEFLGSIEDPGIWSKVREKIKGVPDVAFSIVWELGKAELRKKLGLG